MSPVLGVGSNILGNVGAAGVASLGGDQGVSCSRHSWFQPAPQWTHHGTKLRISAMCVVPLGQCI